MCMIQTPDIPKPELPPEKQASKEPDANAVRGSVGRRLSDQTRSGSNTILTSGSGVQTTGMTERKTLLGQ